MLAYRTAKFACRNCTAVALGAVVVIATIGGLVGTLIQARTARAQRDFAFRQLARAEATNDFNQFLLSDAAPAGKPFTVNDLLERAERILNRQHARNDANRVELLTSIGMQYSIQEQDAHARRVLEDAYQLSRGLIEPSVQAYAACSLASALVRDGELTRAEAWVQEGLRELPDTPQFALTRLECLRRGGEVAEERGDLRGGILRLEAAQRELKKAPFQSDWAEMLTAMDLADAYRSAGQHYKAIELFNRANAPISSLGREETQSAAVLLNNWALSLERLGQPLEAERLYRREINIYRAGQTEETVPPMALINYAKTLRLLGRLKEAADYAGRAYTKAPQAGDQFAIYQSLSARSLIYLDQGDFTRASAVLEELEPMLRRKFSPDNGWFGALALSQARLALGKGQAEQALKLADQGVANFEAALKTSRQGGDFLPIALLRRANIELGAGRAAPAAADASRAVTLQQAGAPPGGLSLYLGEAYWILSRALQAQGKMAEAQLALRSSLAHLEATVGPNHPETIAARRSAESYAHNSH